MKILHINTEPGWRGGEEQLYLLVSGQVKMGHEPVVACYRGGKFHRKLSGTKICPVIPYRVKPFWNVFSLYKLYKHARLLRPDIIHTHTAHAVLPGLLLSLALKTPRLFHSRRVDFRLHRFSRYKYLGANASILAISEGVHSVLISCNIPENRIRIVRSGIAINNLSRERSNSAWRSELGIQPHVPVIGIVAALTDHKGHKYLLQAFPMVLAKFPETVLVVVGSGELEMTLKTQARQSGIIDQVRFTGFRQDARDMINVFDIFVLPSHLEGLGTSLLDAMIRKKPVVSTTAGGIPEIVLDNVTGLLVPPKNPDALAKAIIELLETPDKRELMGREGKKRVMDHFTADKMVEATLDAYLSDREWLPN